MTSTKQIRKEIDIAWLLLIGLTLAMFLLDQDPQHRTRLTGMLLGMAALKSILIGAIFMGLFRASRPALGLLIFSFVTLSSILAFMM